MCIRDRCILHLLIKSANSLAVELNLSDAYTNVNYLLTYQDALCAHVPPAQVVQVVRLVILRKKGFKVLALPFEDLPLLGK